jgi:hypothetical protein
MRTYGFLNLGRDKNPNKSTWRIDHMALTLLRDAIGETNAVAFLCEINEGDDNDEMTLLRDTFTGWRCFGHNTREPIVVSPDIAQGATASVEWVSLTSVKHWSPQRSIQRVDLADGETLVGYHPPAGPYTPGTRPAWAQVPLRLSWHRTNSRGLAAKRDAHQAGRNVTSMCDLNRYDLTPLPGEVEVVHERTDHGWAWAAKGSRAVFRQGESIRVGLDSHQIHTMRGRYIAD